MAAPTSTLPQPQPSGHPTDADTEIDIPEYETDLDLTPEEEEAVDGALVALDGYIAVLNRTMSSGGKTTSRVGDFSQGEALKALRDDSNSLKRDQQYMAGEFKIEDREIQSVDLDTQQVTVLTCVDNSAFARVDNGRRLPKSEPQPLRVVFTAKESDETWKIDSQGLWGEPCEK